MSINDMALLIQASTNAEILRCPRMTLALTDLIQTNCWRLGFPQKNVDIAIREICRLIQRGELENKPQFNNLLYMQTEVFK